MLFHKYHVLESLQLPGIPALKASAFQGTCDFTRESSWQGKGRQLVVLMARGLGFRKGMHVNAAVSLFLFLSLFFCCLSCGTGTCGLHQDTHLYLDILQLAGHLGDSLDHGVLMRQAPKLDSEGRWLFLWLLVSRIVFDRLAIAFLLMMQPQPSALALEMR